jgi:FkbM family methyltransferase
MSKVIAAAPGAVRKVAKWPLVVLPLRLLRLYVRYAPGTLAKAPVVRELDSRLQSRPRRFVTRTRWGARFAGTTEDLIERYIYEFGVWEPNLTGWIGSRLAPGDVFVDVGANIGYFALLGSRLVGSDGAVVAIEASPSNFELLRGNLELNRASNVRAVNVAAADKRGVVRIHDGPPENRGLASTVAPRGGSTSAEIQALPLPEILRDEELRRARVIKIDAEGGEPAILAGLLGSVDLLRDDVEIIAEIAPRFFEFQGLSADEFVGSLRARGFAVHKLELDYRPASHIGRRGVPPTAFRGPVIGVGDYIFSRAA